MSQRSQRRSRDVTPRATLLAFAVILLVSIAGFYISVLYFTASSFGTGVPAAAPFTALLLLTGLAGIPVLRRWVGFTRRELLTVYAIVLMGAPVLSQSILGWMLPHSIALRYMARAIPDWETSFLALMPTWFSPTDPAAVESFFTGGLPVPWSLWWTPLVAWCSFLVALVAASLCLTVLLQRQWISSERLSFPLAQIPLESVSRAADGAGDDVARLPLSGLFWAGIGVSFFIGFFNSLAEWIPAVPGIPTGPIVVMQWRKVGPLAGIGDFEVVLWPWLIGLAYLVPKELSFSCWFFWWFRLGLTVLAIVGGATPQRPDEWYGNTFPAPYWQGIGALLALAGWTAWTARSHLARAVRAAFGRGSPRAAADEPIAYRWALLGFAVSFAFLVYFCWLAGCRIPVGVALIALILIFYMVWARLRAETGMGFLSFPLKVDTVMFEPLGSAMYKPREVIAIIGARWSYFPGYGQSPEIFPGNALESMKIADSAAIRKGPLLAAMAGGFLLALVFGVYVMMTGIYGYGFHKFQCTSTTDWWISQQLHADGARIYNALQNPTRLDPYTILALAAGAAMTIFLGTMRLRFWWWPFHPVGYLASNTWGMKWNWMPFFVGWALKSIVIRYGGLRLYRATVPLAIGLIGGDLLNQVVWGAIQAWVQAGG